MNHTIGENIKIMRRKCGFTQEELAGRLSVTPQAISKWENGNGTPDIAQLVPLSQIFGITTDSLLGVVSATYGNAHTEAALGHEKLLMSTSRPEAEKHLAAYTYFRAESEKEPTNYVIMRKCINHGAGLSRYTDFEGFLADKPQFRDEIFADCERKNICINRYCEDRINVEKANYAMIWIYIHTKEFDKAKELIERLPSLESNNMQESIRTKLIRFQYGFETEKKYIAENISKLLHVTGKEFFYVFEDYAWFADPREAIELNTKILGVLRAYRDFEELYDTALIYENHLRKDMPRCYAALEQYEKAAEELLQLALNYAELSRRGLKYPDAESVKTAAFKDFCTAMEAVQEQYRDKIKSCPAYEKAREVIEGLID
ncbi:MAG: helix-turn-helix transcriptional regulator [Lachnospiraceae bacterium]|nr:helix-turn-helix transcriptional regulator [Lachnospiraceae bacterium]